MELRCPNCGSIAIFLEDSCLPDVTPTWGCDRCKYVWDRNKHPRPVVEPATTITGKE